MKSNLVLYLFVSFLLPFLGACGRSDSGAIDLAFRPSRGTIMRQRSVVDETLEWRVGGRSTSLRSEMDIDITYSIDDVLPDGSVAMGVTVDSVRFFLVDSARRVPYRPGVSVQGASSSVLLYDLLDGESITVVLDSRNRIQEVVGIDSLRGRWSAKIARSEASAMYRAAQESIVRQLNGEKIAWLLQSGLVRFPDRPVNVGDSWSYDIGVPANVHVTETLRKVSGGMATIDLVGTAVTDSSVTSSGGRQRLSGGYTAEVVIDISDGHGVEARIVQDYSVVHLSSDSATIVGHAVGTSKVWKE